METSSSLIERADKACMKKSDRELSAIVSRDGKVTIPKKIRDAFGLKPGCKLDFKINDQGDLVLFQVESPAPSADPTPPAARVLS